MRNCSSLVCSRQTLFFHQLISCWEKKGIKVRKSQCLWMRFTLTPHLCSAWKNLTPESLHMQELSSSSYELLISHTAYSKSLYCYTTFDSVQHKWWLCHLKKYGEKKKKKTEKSNKESSLISYCTIFFFIIFHFPSNVIRVFWKCNRFFLKISSIN